jgi:hypothetical protein
MSYASIIKGTSGVVSYWPLNESSGVVANDVVGSNDGEYMGTVTLGEAGPIGAETAAGFDGSSGRVEIPETPELHPVHVSVEAWVNPISLPGHGGVFCTSYPPSVGYELGLGVGVVQPSEKLSFGTFSSTSGWCVAEDGEPSLTVWSHLVGTYDGAYFRLYINGVEIADAYGGPLEYGSAPLRIGRNHFTEADGYWHGGIAQVALYDRALPEATVKEHYEAGLGGTPRITGVAEGVAGAAAALTASTQIPMAASGASSTAKMTFSAGPSAGFPTVALLDSFKRNETPLSNGGKWALKFTDSQAGLCNGNAFENHSAADTEGAYWTPEEFTEPGVAITRNERIEDSGTWRLWACLSTPTTTNISGYLLAVRHEGGTSFEVQLFRVDKNAYTELTKALGESIEEGDSMGLAVQGGKVEYWVKHGAGAWTERLAASDATYTTGFVGFDVYKSADGDTTNFEAGGSGGPGKLTGRAEAHATTSLSLTVEGEVNLELAKAQAIGTTSFTPTTPVSLTFGSATATSSDAIAIRVLIKLPMVTEGEGAIGIGYAWIAWTPAPKVQPQLEDLWFYGYSSKRSMTGRGAAIAGGVGEL